MGVIDDDRSAALMLGDELQTPGDPGQIGESGRSQQRPEPPVAITKPSAASAFIAWNSPASGSTSSCLRPKISRTKELAAGPRLAGNQPQIGRRISAIGDHRMTALAAERLEPQELSAVSVEDRGAAGHQRTS